MNDVESTDRTLRDAFHFGLTGFGELVLTAGVVTTTLWAFICGLVLIFLGLAYFVLGLDER